MEYWNSIKEGIVIQYNVECVRVDYNGGLIYLMSDSQSLSRLMQLTVVLKILCTTLSMSCHIFSWIIVWRR